MDHAPVAHDDLANAVLGAAVLCGRPAAPMLVALPESAAALLGDAWRRKQAPEELERLALLEKVAEHESAAGEALLRRYQESYDHAALDGLEAQHKAA